MHYYNINRIFVWHEPLSAKYVYIGKQGWVWGDRETFMSATNDVYIRHQWLADDHGVFTGETNYVYIRNHNPTLRDRTLATQATTG